MKDKIDSVFDRLILTIVGRGCGEKIVEASKKAGAKGGTIVPGRGTADNEILRFLGIEDVEKDIILTLTESGCLEAILSEFALRSESDKKIRGCSAVIGVSSIMKCIVSERGGFVENIKTGEKRMDLKASYEMISVIVNSGFADDVMAAARKAGASGGTIINARGTGKEEDVKFFGISIVPEKELLFMIADRSKASAILDSIKDLSCFSTPGSGICFCTDVEKFMLLGSRKK